MLDKCKHPLNTCYSSLTYFLLCKHCTLNTCYIALVHSLKSVVITNKMEKIATFSVGMDFNFQRWVIMSFCKLCKHVHHICVVKCEARRTGAKPSRTHVTGDRPWELVVQVGPGKGGWEESTDKKFTAIEMLR